MELNTAGEYIYTKQYKWGLRLTAFLFLNGKRRRFFTDADFYKILWL